MLHAGDFDAARAFVVNDEIRKPAQSCSPKTSGFVKKRKAPGLLLDFSKPEVEIIPEAICGGQRPFSVVVKHLIEVVLDARMKAQAHEAKLRGL